MRRFRVALGMAVAAIAALSAVPALAWDSYCDTEPPVTLVTPNGNHVTINNFLSYSTSDRSLVHDVDVSATAAPAGDSLALVTITVETPSGGHRPLLVTSTSGRYDTSVSGLAPWGDSTTLYLVIPDPPLASIDDEDD